MLPDLNPRSGRSRHLFPVNFLLSWGQHPFIPCRSAIPNSLCPVQYFFGRSSATDAARPKIIDETRTAYARLAHCNVRSRALLQEVLSPARVATHIPAPAQHDSLSSMSFGKLCGGVTGPLDAGSQMPGDSLAMEQLRSPWAVHKCALISDGECLVIAS